MAKLSSAEDRQEAESAVDSSKGNIIKIEDGHNWIILLEEDFEQGFIHWVLIGDKTTRRVCAGGLEGNGWAVDECDLCSLAKDQYDIKKQAKTDGDKGLVKEYNDKGNQLRANYCAIFKAIKLGTKLKQGKNKKTGKPMKRYVPDIESVQVGKLSLTHAQLKKVFKLIEVDEETGDYPFDFISNGEDLINRPLDFLKKKDDKKLYSELQTITPMKKTIEFEIVEEDIPDISEEFEFTDDLDKIVALYNGEAEAEDEGEYEEQELEVEHKKTEKTGKKAITAKNKTALSSKDAEILDDDEIPF